MKPFLILLFNFLFFLPYSQATVSTDSLFLTKNDSTKAAILNEFAFQQKNYNPDLAFSYAEQAYQLSKDGKIPKEEANSWIRKGIIARITGEYTKAENYLKEGLEIRISLEDKGGISNVYNNLGLVKKYAEQYKESKNYYLKALNYTPSLKSEAAIYNNLGDISILLTDYKKAIDYFDQSIAIRKERSDSVGIARVLLNKGNLYLQLSNWEKAEESYQRSRKIYKKNAKPTGEAKCLINLSSFYCNINKYEKGLSCCEEALLLQEVISKNDLATILYNKGSSYTGLKRNEPALESYSSSLALHTELGNEQEVAALHFEIGTIHQNQKNYPKAKTCYLDCLSKQRDDFDPFLKAQLYQKLAETYSQNNQSDSAFIYSQLYNTIKDSIHFYKTDAINYQQNLEAEQKKTAQLELQVAKIEKANLWKMSLLIFFILSSLLGIVAFSNYHNRKKRQLAEVEIDDILQSQELRIVYAKLDAKDEAQKRIGDDLHDSIGAMLSTVKLYFADFGDKIKGLQIDMSQQQKGLHLLDDMAQEVRRISHNLQHSVLAKFGLVSAVKDLVETISNANQIKANVQAFGFKQRIPDDIERKIFKIIQELVGNVLKHAKAKSLTIYLHREEESFNLVVEDDGIGFKPDEINDKGGIGLQNITYRVSQLEGTCHFDSGKGKGTNVIIDIPIKND